MKQDLHNTIALLERTPAALDGLLRGLPEAWTGAREGDGAWSPLEIVGHLIHGDRTDWMPRIRRILDEGDARAFDPFDRLGQRREIEGKSLEQLLDEFRRVRAAKLDELRALKLTPDDMRRRGMHPSLGPVTMANLLATWAAHDLTHLHQISRVLAHQYRGEVGPWVKYLGVLQCAGHSE